MIKTVNEMNRKNFLFRRICLILLSGFMLLMPMTSSYWLASAAGATASVAPHWVDSYVATLTDAGVLRPGDFAREEYDIPITRGRFILVFARLLEDAGQSVAPLAESAATGRPFTDIPRESRFYAAAVLMKSTNLIQGYPDGIFRPAGTQVNVSCAGTGFQIH